jgi:hypothetical protein
MLVAITTFLLPGGGASKTKFCLSPSMDECNKRTCSWSLQGHVVNKVSTETIWSKPETNIRIAPWLIFSTDLS